MEVDCTTVAAHRLISIGKSYPTPALAEEYGLTLAHDRNLQINRYPIGDVSSDLALPNTRIEFRLTGVGIDCNGSNPVCTTRGDPNGGAPGAILSTGRVGPSQAPPAP